MDTWQNALGGGGVGGRGSGKGGIVLGTIVNAADGTDCCKNKYKTGMNDFD